MEIFIISEHHLLLLEKQGSSEDHLLLLERQGSSQHHLLLLETQGSSEDHLLLLEKQGSSKDHLLILERQGSSEDPHFEEKKLRECFSFVKCHICKLFYLSSVSSIRLPEFFCHICVNYRICQMSSSNFFYLKNVSSIE